MPTPLDDRLSASKVDSLTKFGKLAAPHGRCHAQALARELQVELKDFFALQTQDGMIHRDKFLAWLLCKQFGDHSIHGDALLLRSAFLASSLQAAPAEVWPGNCPTTTTVKISKAASRILEEALASFAKTPTPDVRASTHFAKVAEHQFDANSIPFPHAAFRTGFPKPVSKLVELADLEKHDVNHRQFPMPAGERETVAKSEGERESVKQWREGRAKEAADLRKEVHDDIKTLDTVAAPWPMVEFSVKNDEVILKDAKKRKSPKPRWPVDAAAAESCPEFLTGHLYLRSQVHAGAVSFNVEGQAWAAPKEGVIAKDIVTKKQADIESFRQKKGVLSEKALARRRIRIAKFFVREKFGTAASAPPSSEFLTQIMPTIEKDAALEKFRTRLSEERAAAVKLFEARAAEGAKITAWPQEATGCWPSPDRLWERFCRRFSAKRTAAPKLKKIRSLRKPKDLVKPPRKIHKISTKAADKEAQKMDENVAERNAYGGLVEDASMKPAIVAFADLLELKSYICPPREVVQVMNIIITLMAGLEPSFHPGSTADSTWSSAKRFLASPIKLLQHFDRTLKPFESGSLPAGSIEQARTSQVELIKACSISKIRTKSSAAANVCEWAAGVFQYYDLCKRGAPLEHSVATATSIADAFCGQINSFGPPPQLKVPVPYQAVAALQAAAKSFDEFDKDSLLQVRTLVHPPKSITAVAESILILFAGTSINISAEAKKEISWLSMRKVMTDPIKFSIALKKLHADIEANRVPLSNVEKVFKVQKGLGQRIDADLIKRQFQPMTHLASWLENVLTYYHYASASATTLFVPPPRTSTSNIVDTIQPKASVESMFPHTIDEKLPKQLSTPARSARYGGK